MKVVEKSSQNTRNCTIFKNSLGGAYPQTPLATAHSFASCIPKIPKILKLGTPLNLYSTKHRNNLNIQIKIMWCT